MFKKFMVILLACVCLPVTSIANTAHHHKHHRKHRTVAKNTDYNVVSTSGDVQRFEKRYASLLQHWRVPGSSVAVMKDGHLLYAHGFGYADVSTQQPVTPSSLFRIASISKAITAVATLQLIEKQQISLDSKVLPIINVTPIGNRPSSSINNMTVRNLLTMSAGMDRGVNSSSYDPMFGPWPSYVSNRVGGTPASCQQMVALHAGMPLAFRPGTRYAYSNLTYCTLGLVIDKTVGNNYDPSNYVNYVYANILTPLGITDMQIAHTAYSARSFKEVHYYPYFTQTSEHLAVADLPYSNTRLLEHNYADGGWLATPTDLVKIGDAVANYKLLSRSSVEMMLSPPSYLQSIRHSLGNYFGMGWSVHWMDRFLTWEKTGSFTGTYGFLLHTADGYTYAILCNTRPTMTKRFHQQVKQLLLKTEFKNV